MSPQTARQRLRAALSHPLVRFLLMIGIAVGAFFLLITILRIDTARVVTAVADVRLELFLLVCLCVYGVVAGNAARWDVLVRQQVPVTYRRAFIVWQLTFFVNLLLPLRGGDLGRLVLVSRMTGASKARLVALEFIDRTIDFSSMLALAMVLLLFLPLPPGIKTGIMALFGVVLGGVVCLLLVGHFFREPAGSSPRRILAKFAEGARAIRGLRPLLTAFVVAFLPWLWETGMMVLMGRAARIDLAFPVAMAVLFSVNLSFLIPTPAQVGAYEGLGVATLIFFGVDRSVAVAYMFLFHLAHICAHTVLGLILFLRIRKELPLKGLSWSEQQPTDGDDNGASPS